MTNELASQEQVYLEHTKTLNQTLIKENQLLWLKVALIENEPCQGLLATILSQKMHSWFREAKGVGDKSGQDIYFTVIFRDTVVTWISTMPAHREFSNEQQDLINQYYFLLFKDTYNCHHVYFFHTN